jgi:hypothetical protein
VAGNARVAASRLGFGVAISRLNDDVEERREEREEKRVVSLQPTWAQ